MTPQELAAFTRDAQILVRANDDHTEDFAQWEDEA